MSDTTGPCDHTRRIHSEIRRATRAQAPQDPEGVVVEGVLVGEGREELGQHLLNGGRRR